MNRSLVIRGFNAGRASEVPMNATVLGAAYSPPEWSGGVSSAGWEVMDDVRRTEGRAEDYLRRSAVGRDASASEELRFIDLFAGIGGTRLAFEGVGAKCVFASEIDLRAQKVYIDNSSGGTQMLDHPMEGNIHEVSAADVPDHDVLVAGFPCQPFSIAGVSKKNSLGRPHGFQCESQGNAFEKIEDILGVKTPKALLLENVKNLQHHDDGQTFVRIRTGLERLGYRLAWRIFDASSYVPQKRKRILIAGFREDIEFSWDCLRLPDRHPTLGEVLHPEDGSEPSEEPYTVGTQGAVSPKYTLTDGLWQYLQDYAAKHRAAGHGFGFGLVRHQDVARTLSARYYKDGSEILIFQGEHRPPRRLTPRECARLMGFPDSFRLDPVDSRAYKQLGNSVVVPLLTDAAEMVVRALRGELPATNKQQEIALP